MERIDKKEATARCWAEISLDTICENYRWACEIAKTEVICVLKANAYGMGATEVCRALKDSGAGWFAVASGDEAEELLHEFPDIRILILGLVGEAQAQRLAGKNVSFTLFSKEQGERLRKVSKAVGEPLRVHIKADTGLHRLGFPEETAAEEIVSLASSGCFCIEGLFTHLALRSPESDQRQFASFENIRRELEKRKLSIPCMHMLDSIGMVRYPQYAMDAVRIGAWLYGVMPRNYEHPEHCRPVVRFCARIAQIHRIPTGEQVGYDNSHPLKRDSRIATLTAGYIDGVPRMTAGEVSVAGNHAPVVGVACMDQMMIDVTDIPEAGEGDEVCFLGDDIIVNEYAAWAGLNRNEALGRIGRRVIRVYQWKGQEYCVRDTGCSF